MTHYCEDTCPDCHGVTSVPAPEVDALTREAADRLLHGMEAVCRLQGYAVRTWSVFRGDLGRFGEPQLWVEHLVLTAFRRTESIGYATSRGWLNDGPLESAVIERREAVAIIARRIAREAQA